MQRGESRGAQRGDGGQREEDEPADDGKERSQFKDNRATHEGAESAGRAEAADLLTETSGQPRSAEARESQRQRDQDRLDPAALQIVNTRGTPTAEGTPHVAAGSNVLIVTYDTDPEFTASIDAALEGLR